MSINRENKVTGSGKNSEAYPKKKKFSGPSVLITLTKWFRAELVDSKKIYKFFKQFKDDSFIELRSFGVIKPNKVFAKTMTQKKANEQEDDSHRFTFFFWKKKFVLKVKEFNN